MIEVFAVFSRIASVYQEQHKEVPVIVVDNANKLPDTLLFQFQDFAKQAADENLVKFIFVSSEGTVPRRMRGT